MNWDFVEIAAQKAQYGGHSMESRWTGGWGIPIDQYKLAMMIYQREMIKRNKRKKKCKFFINDWNSFNKELSKKIHLKIIE